MNQENLISKFDLDKEINSYPKTLQNKIFRTQRELEGQL